jgi:thermitase
MLSLLLWRRLPVLFIIRVLILPVILAVPTSTLSEYEEIDHPGYACGLTTTYNISKESHLQWYLHNNGTFPYSASKPGADINICAAWQITHGDSSVTVAVLDSGIDRDLPEFTNRLWENIDDVIGWDFINDDNNPDDDAGHGTAIAGVLAANYNNQTGLIGIDQKCKIMVCKTLDNNLTGYYSQWIKAIHYAVDNGAHIINFSMAGFEPSQALHKAIQYAESKGVLIVAGMGNTNSEQQCFPAAYPEVLAVGATDPNDRRSISFNGVAGRTGSNHGDHIDVVAPGNYILSLSMGGLQSTMRAGTSLSTPMVTGIASLLLAQNRNSTPQQLRMKICLSAADLVGDPVEDVEGWDRFYGFGRVDAARALLFDQPLSVFETAPHLYPNPASDQTTLFGLLDNPSEAQITIFDLAGKEIATHYLKPRRLINVQLDLTSLPPAQYVVRLQTATGIVVDRLQVTR